MDAINTERCDLCWQGRLIAREETMTFWQRTGRGRVSCDVTVLTTTCDKCGAKSWDAAAEATIEAAVRRAEAAIT